MKVITSMTAMAVGLVTHIGLSGWIRRQGRTLDIEVDIVNILVVDSDTLGPSFDGVMLGGIEAGRRGDFRDPIAIQLGTSAVEGKLGAVAAAAAAATAAAEC